MLLKTSTAFAILAVLATSGAAPIRRHEGANKRCHTCEEVTSGPSDPLGPLTGALAGAGPLGGLGAGPAQGAGAGGLNLNGLKSLNLLGFPPTAGDPGRPGPGEAAPLLELLPGKNAPADSAAVNGAIGPHSPLKIIPFHGSGEKILGVNLGDVHAGVNLPVGVGRVSYLAGGAPILGSGPAPGQGPVSPGAPLPLSGFTPLTGLPGPGQGHGQGQGLPDELEEIGFGNPSFMLARPFLGGVTSESEPGPALVPEGLGIVPGLDVNGASPGAGETLDNTPGVNVDVKDINAANGLQPDVDVLPQNQQATANNNNNNKNEQVSAPPAEQQQQQPQQQSAPAVELPKTDPAAIVDNNNVLPPLDVAAVPSAKPEDSDTPATLPLVEPLKVEDKPAEVTNTLEKTVDSGDATEEDKVEDTVHAAPAPAPAPETVIPTTNKVADDVHATTTTQQKDEGCHVCESKDKVDLEDIKGKLEAMHLEDTVESLKDDILGKTSHLLSLFSPSSAFNGAAQCASAPAHDLPEHTVACATQPSLGPGSGRHSSGSGSGADETLGATVELCIPQHLYTQRPHNTIACPADLQRSVVEQLLQSRSVDETENDESWDVLGSDSDWTETDPETETTSQSDESEEGTDSPNSDETHEMDKRDVLAFVKLCLTANLQL